MAFDIRQAIAIINGMETDGVIDRYAIGGAVGAILDDRVLDMRRFDAILARNGLVDRWRQFERQFLS